MEKNQQNPAVAPPSSGEEATGGGRPGQQLPPGNKNTLAKPEENPASREKHSESSLPANDGETLGTP
jgi:hypothetical protein